MPAPLQDDEQRFVVIAITVTAAGPDAAYCGLASSAPGNCKVVVWDTCNAREITRQLRQQHIAGLTDANATWRY